MIHAAILTILIETSLFFLYGYREKRFLVIVALSNLLTNVSLNLCILISMIFCSQFGETQLPVYIVIIVGEIGAVTAEYYIYAQYLEKHSRILFLQTLASNAASFLTGLMISHFVDFGSSLL